MEAVRGKTYTIFSSGTKRDTHIEPQPPFKTHFSALLKLNVFLSHGVLQSSVFLLNSGVCSGRSLLSDSLTALERRRDREVFVWWQWFIVFLIY